MPRLILASASPRRLELIKGLVPAFSVATSDVEATGSERFPEWNIVPLPLVSPFFVPVDADPRLWAWRKGVDISTRLPEPQGDLFVLAADTVVIAPGEILGKPRDVGDARRMLLLLRGKEHFVATGYVILRRSGQTTVAVQKGAVLTRVTMRDFSMSELEGYVATAEPYDKAGAYALQGAGGQLLRRVEGCVTNVIGLPVCAVREALTDLNFDLLDPPAEGYCSFCKSRTLNRDETGR